MQTALTEPVSESRYGRVRARARGHLGSHLIRSGYALVLSSAITGGLGLPYWLFVSRLYSAAAVGQGAAIIAALLLVTSLATAGVKRGLLRFVPESGRYARKLVTRTYLAVMAVSATAALVFVLGAHVWADNLVSLRSNRLAGLTFVAAAAIWAVFVLQDAVLVATRHSWAVPVENGAFSVAKIALLVGLASVAAEWGIVLSWVLPSALAVISVTVWLNRRTGVARAEHPPDAVARAVPADSLPTLGQLLRFVGPQHFAALLWYATLSVIPLMVIDRLGAAHNAHYYVAEQVAFALFLLSSNVTDALVAEGAADPKALGRNLRQAVWQVVLMLLLPLVALVVFAPQVMGLFGAGYRSEATTLLRLLAIAALPNTVNTFVVGLAAIRLRMTQVVAMEGAAFSVTLTLTWVFLGRWGLTGVGWAFLLSQMVVATGALLTAAARTPAMRQGPRALAVAGLRAGRGGLRAVRSRAVARRLLAELGTSSLPAADGDWTLMTSGHDVIVLSAPGPPGASVVRLAAGSCGRSSIQRHRRGITTVHSDSRLAALTGQVPRPLDHAPDDAWMVETVGSGLAASAALADPATAARAGRAVVSACDRLHRVTARRLEVGDAELNVWVEQPAAALAGVVRGARPENGLAAVTAYLRAELDGRDVTVTRVHGDLSASNLLLTEDSSEVSAILDWESATEALPELDLVQFVLARRWEQIGGELGGHVVDVLRDGWSDEERSLLSSSWSANASVPQRTLVMLAWLAHVSHNIDKTSRYEGNRWWVRHNVDVVLRELTVGGTLDLDSPPNAAPALEPPPWRVWRRPAVTKESWPTIGLVFAGVMAWLTGTWGINPGAMSDLGLLSILRPPAYLGLGLLLVAFGVEVGRRQQATWRLAAPLAVFVALVHGTPAVLYGTLRYSWAWKHIGIIDYIQRHGSVDPNIAHLNVYQNWPGFFAVSAAFSSLFGIGAPVHAARWWPVLANLAVIPVLLLIYRGLGGDRRRSWTAVAFFLTANWVGQDYFSPQSFAYLLYLGVIAIVVNRFRRDTGHASATVGETRKWSAGWVWLVLCLATAAIVSSHQITPFMLVVALAALLVTRRVRTLTLGITAIGMSTFWALTAASPFIRANFSSLIGSVGKPAANTDRNLVDQGRLSGSQVLVSNMGRAVVALIVVAAAVGVVRCLRRRQLDGVALALTISPAALVLANDFDGEIVFRTFLFAMPFLAWFAAQAVWPPAGEDRQVLWPRLRRPVVTDGWRAAIAVTLAATLLVGFLFGYYGKERWYYFSHDEVAASNLVFSNAPAGSLLVAGTGDFPLQWKRYEKLTYVFIADEPADGQAHLLAHPADTLAGWLGDRRYKGAYLLITRSQKAEVEGVGGLPLGSLDRIERALLHDRRFRAIFRSPNATVFTRADQRQG